jgi:hypothetical protein
MVTLTDFIIRTTKETIYLHNTLDEVVVKFTPGKPTLVKFAGENPFEAKKGSKMVLTACMEQNIITESDFNNF